MAGTTLHLDFNAIAGPSGIGSDRVGNRKYVKSQELEGRTMQYTHNFYIHNETNSNCQLAMLRLFTKDSMVVKWGKTKDMKATSEFTEWLNDLVPDIVRCMMCYGFVPWNTTKRVDSMGRVHTVPTIVDPVDGSTFICVKKDYSREVRHFTKYDAKSEKQKEFPVFTYPMFMPTNKGILTSPLAGVLMSAITSTNMQNLDAEAATTLARPPIVYERKDPFVDKQLYANLVNGLLPGIPSPSQALRTDPGAPGGGTGLDSDPTDALRRYAYLNEASDGIRAGMIAKFGSSLGWNGSPCFIPDQMTGYLPVDTQRGPYANNEWPLREGAHIAAQQLPKRDPANVMARLERLDKDIAGMWGVPLVFINKQSSSYKDDSLLLKKELYDNANKLAEFVAKCLEHILNELFEEEDTKRLKMMYYGKSLKGVPRESEPMTKLRDQITTRKRYTVSFQLGIVATPEEVKELRKEGLTDKVYVSFLEKQHNLPHGSLPLETLRKPNVDGLASLTQLWQQGWDSDAYATAIEVMHALEHGSVDRALLKKTQKQLMEAMVAPPGGQGGAPSPSSSSAGAAPKKRKKEKTSEDKSKEPAAKKPKKDSKPD